MELNIFWSWTVSTSEEAEGKQILYSENWDLWEMGPTDACHLESTVLLHEWEFLQMAPAQSTHYSFMV